MEGVYITKECSVEVERIIPACFHGEEDLYSIESDFNIIIDKGRYERIVQGGAMEATLRIELNEEDEISAPCLDLDMADIKRKEAKDLEKKYMNSLAEISHLRANEISKERMMEEKGRILKHQRELMTSLSMAVVDAVEYRDVKFMWAHSKKKEIEKIGKGWEELEEKDPGSGANSAQNCVNVLNRLLNHYIGIIQGAGKK